MRIKSVKAVKSRLEVEFECKGRIKNFFITRKFYAEYNGCNIEKVPEHILVIPFLATVCPVAWVNQAEIQVNSVDEKFLHSLEKIRLVFQRLYPKLIFYNNIHAKKIVKSSVIDTKSKSMMLFSGGIDSLATFLRHRNERPIVVSVHGADILIEDYQAWKEKTKDFPNFAQVNNVELLTVRSNFYEMLDRVILRGFNKKLGGNWYVHIMFGPSLLALCAPLTYLFNIDKLYIAASYCFAQSEACGSLPEIDDNLTWDNTRCVHDGYELTRQQKIQKIAEYVKQTHNRLPLRVCLSRLGFNCSSGRCYKCGFTITGLEIAGLRPNEHGFNVNSQTFADIKEHITNRGIFNAYRRFVWTELKSYAQRIEKPADREAEEFIEWLKSADIDKLGLKTQKQKLFWDSISPVLICIPYPLRLIFRRNHEILQKSKRLKKIIHLN